jgi:hypothetical protein
MAMRQSSTAERWLVLLLRLVGGVCLLALAPLWMPRGCGRVQPRATSKQEC